MRQSIHGEYIAAVEPSEDLLTGANEHETQQTSEVTGKTTPRTKLVSAVHGSLIPVGLSGFGSLIEVRLNDEATLCVLKERR